MTYQYCDKTGKKLQRQENVQNFKKTYIKTAVTKQSLQTKTAKKLLIFNPL